MEPTAGTGPEVPLPPQGETPKAKKHHILLIVGLSILGLLIVVGAVLGIYAWRFNEGQKNIVIEEVNLSRVPNGTYEGEASNFHDSAKVNVTVQDHLITEIEILKVSPSGMQAKIEDLVQRIIALQTPNVDIVSGASASSKVFLKAVDNALVPAQS
jgi:uncharacterized protein with FMN-binding domain